MSQNHPETLTQHAMLVVWGQFAQSIGLIDQTQSVSLHQKTMAHSPQRKVLEFLVAILAGLIAAALPARRAARLDILEAITTE